MVARDPLPPEVREAIDRGDALEAIKLLRKRTGFGLKEAKDAVERGVRGEAVELHGRAALPEALPPPVAAALLQGDKVGAIKLMREHAGLGLKEAKDAIERSPERLAAPSSGLSPGEVPRSGGPGRWLLIVAIVVAVLYIAFGRGSPAG